MRNTEMVHRMAEIDAVEKARCPPPVPEQGSDENPPVLSPRKARLVQRTRERYEKGLKRLSEI